MTLAIRNLALLAAFISVTVALWGREPAVFFVTVALILSALIFDSLHQESLLDNPRYTRVIVRDLAVAVATFAFGIAAGTLGVEILL